MCCLRFVACSWLCVLLLMSLSDVLVFLVRCGLLFVVVCRLMLVVVRCLSLVVAVA